MNWHTRYCPIFQRLIGITPYQPGPKPRALQRTPTGFGARGARVNGHGWDRSGLTAVELRVLDDTERAVRVLCNAVTDLVRRRSAR